MAATRRGARRYEEARLGSKVAAGAGDASARVAASAVPPPAMSAATYSAVMGVDRFADVIANIKRLIEKKNSNNAGTPMVVPAVRARLHRTPAPCRE